MRTGHKAVRKGKRVLVQFADGRKVEDYFEEGKPKFLFFRKLGKVLRGSVKNLTIVKDFI